MVAYKKVNRDTAVADFGQFSQYAYKAFRDDRFILEPKLKQVAHEVNGHSIVRCHVEPAHQLPLPFSTGQPGIGAEVVGNSPEEAQAAIRAEIPRWEKIVREIAALVGTDGAWIQYTYALAHRRIPPGFHGNWLADA